MTPSVDERSHVRRSCGVNYGCRGKPAPLSHSSADDDRHLRSGVRRRGGLVCWFHGDALAAAVRHRRHHQLTESKGRQDDADRFVRLDGE